MKISFAKTPFLILFVILISVGITSAYAINITLGGSVDITQILNMMGNKIINVGNPTTPSDAATKAYVDSAPGTDTLASLGCTNGQTVQLVGSVWTCGKQTAKNNPITIVDRAGDTGRAVGPGGRRPSGRTWARRRPPS